MLSPLILAYLMTAAAFAMAIFHPELLANSFIAVWVLAL